VSGQRRIDTVLQPEFLVGLGALDLDELRVRRNTAEDVETQISYYRRLLHGRMDLLNFALPEILASGMVLGPEPNLRHIDVMPPLPTTTGRRLIDKIMDDGILTQLPELSDEEVDESLERLREVETELSTQRKQLHSIIDALQDEIVARYRSQQDQAPVSG
jgi:hypothetical protein